MVTLTGIRSKFGFVKNSTVVTIAIVATIMTSVAFDSQPSIGEVVVSTFIAVVAAGILVLSDWVYSN